MSSTKEPNRPFLADTGRLFELIVDLTEQKERAAQESETIGHDLKELTNAVDCLSGLNRIIQHPDLTLDQAVGEILDLIPAAWQYPDETAARITFEGREYKTSNFIVETPWRHTGDILILGEPKGLLEVFYLEEKVPDFSGILMWENADFIKAFASGIGVLFERFRWAQQLDGQANRAQKAREKTEQYATRLARAVTKLKSMKEACEETENRMHWLLARISSELRTMLVGISNIAGKGLETSSEEIGEPLHQIRSEAEHIVHITNRIYDYAHISCGKFRHNNTEFRLRDVVENAVDQFYDSARKKGIDLIIMIDPFVPERVIGDGNRLSQILSYLLENALNRTGDGEITVRANVEVSAHMLPVFHFIVSDNGPGIVTESHGQLFEVCADDSESLAKGNLYARLGTAIAKHMVEILGGEIWIAGREGKTEGNEIHFTMWLDVVKGQEGSAMSREAEILGGRRALVADSSETHHALYRLLLEYWGMDSSAVSSGKEALELIEAAAASDTPLAAVIIDASLPDMGAYEVAEQIHARGWTEQTGVILTFAGDLPPDEDRFKAIGVSAALGKPIRQSALQIALTSVVLEKIKQNQAGEKAGSEEAATPPAPEDQAQAPAGPTGKRILLTDQKSDPRRAMAAKLLQKRGHSAMIATDGKQALTVINNGECDIAFIDMTMPEMSALDVVRAVREHEGDTGNHIPVIAVEAKGDTIDRAACREAGIDDFLTDPIAFKKLFEMIDTYCSQPQPAQPTGESQSKHVMRFDRDRALAMVDGDPEMLTDVIEIFEDDCGTFLSAVNDALAADDHDKVIDLVAKIRESGTNVGAMKIVEIMGQLASLSFPADGERARELVRLLQEEFGAFRKVAEAFSRTTIA